MYYTYWFPYSIVPVHKLISIFIHSKNNFIFPYLSTYSYTDIQVSLYTIWFQYLYIKKTSHIMPTGFPYLSTYLYKHGNTKKYTNNPVCYTYYFPYLSTYLYTIWFPYLPIYTQLVSQCTSSQYKN